MESKIPVSNIEALRRNAGLTQRQLAEAVGVTEATLRNWEKNRNSVELFQRVARLCAALGCKPEDLIRLEPPESTALE